MTNTQFDLLLSLTSIRSDGVISAMRAVLVDGETQKAASEQYGVNPAQLSIRLGVLKAVDQTVSKLTPFYSH
ncbi:Na(+)-translocating NADH-quinone reductase subunit C [Edwardsiella piscicida]|uniref:PapB/FocB family fimbrial expression transcriptional regulator n=2 Tax=Edwardsiella piscicida TaxID=1263550 RepID=A0AAQ3C0V9_EDWPI|nr:PapB/FocB family fimbrial expression transcriptional regulator [Edwardsiella piscicida]ACY85911.1 Na(+)-translocating NADH-quinone reductase subunit C [Edwardsiella tarda EIB202]MDM3866540.1 PapB/FocB family fimbrial expression transcriptional regulator [Edwardsiella piscicida]QHR95294.1 transcriptional regulator [Edwardsiella piscicida]UJT82118.1 adhesin biosynthesis transcription regulatory family protein [Edwardsiella piscicida]UJT85386.1 adhesin biosynthesis transcription regulatory fam